MLIERLREHCAEREIGGKLYRERDCLNNVLSERLGEQCDEREIGGQCAEREMGNTVLSEIAGTLC